MKRRETLKIFGLLPLMPLSGFASFKIKNKTIEKSKAYTNNYNLVVYGATPGGIACALRAAREGLQVLLVNYNHHLGGQFVNGIGTMDTLYNGARAPIYDEFRYSIYDFYRSTYGYQSPQYKATQPGFPKTRFESHVVEKLINDILQRESEITILKGYYPLHVEINDRILESISFKRMDSDDIFVARGTIFADCSYEGDLAAISGVDYRLGRESQKEFGEKNAGVCYYKKDYWPPPENIINQENFKLARRLNLSRYTSWSDRMPQSTGEAHEAIMAYNIRTTLTNDPLNRILPDKPKNYDPEYLKDRFSEIRGAGLGVPNQKTSWNNPRLVGLPNKYVEGDWAERRRIIEKFREITLGLLYFKQNDPSVPKDEQSMWKQYGLPKNEYTDNGNLPYELYVREARRIVGRSIFTEHNAMLAEGLKRAPIQNDSISVTEWFMDSHFCTERQVEGSKMEGEVMLKNKTFPGQVSFGTIFPKNLDNLMVPVCLSSTHIGWGTIRLEPTWMSIGEAAGYAATIAIHQKISPSEINRDQFIRLLAKKRIMLSFFNDLEGREYSSWYPSVQYLGTQGFFSTYDALPNEKLTIDLANAWLTYFEKWINESSVDSIFYTKKIFTAEQITNSKLITVNDFAKRLGKAIGNPGLGSRLVDKLKIFTDSHITRGDACRLIFEITNNLVKNVDS
jgi:hypothetical protein